VQVAELAQHNAIPARFLVQILLQLKEAGFVQSVRGSAGGYHLSIDPSGISLLDLIRLMDGPSALGLAEDDFINDRKGENIGHEARSDSLNIVRPGSASRQHGTVGRFDGDRPELVLPATTAPNELLDLCKSGKKIDLIDVRTPVDFREVHVEVARNVPLDQVPRPLFRRPGHCARSLTRPESS
jgi:hypothetical protein